MFHVFGTSTSDQPADTSRYKAIVPLFQPIYALGRGRVVGFEALARLADGEALLTPAQFLPSLDGEELLQLFRAMLTGSLAFLHALDPCDSLYVTVNVNVSLVQQESFVDLVGFILDEHGCEPGRLVLEILESEAIESVETMARSIHRLRSLGVGVALDDVGSAYASLTHIKDLPVNIVKLDQSFSRLLASRPTDLHFVASMVNLARRLNRTLVVEGAETPEVVDALRMIGVEYAQGYALGRPMPASAVSPWLGTSDIRPAVRGPCTLLGAYAAHLTIAEACHTFARQPLPMRWREGANDPHRCGIGRYFDAIGLHDTEFGLAHKRFHYKLCPEEPVSGALTAASELGDALFAALSVATTPDARHHVSIEDEARPAAACGSRTIGAAS